MAPEIVVVSDSPQFPGQLVFQAEFPQAFFELYSDWISRYGILNELFMMKAFVQALEKDGWKVVFGPSAQPVLDNYNRWETPLEIDGFSLTKPDGQPGLLFPYQSFTLRRALERATTGKHRDDRFMFVGWATGTGKSLFAAAGAQELFNQGAVDVVLAFTSKPLGKSLHQFFAGTTALDAVLVDGTPAKRAESYSNGHQVYILNYEKAHWDGAVLSQLVAGKRPLYVLDEVQKVLTADRKTLARKGLDMLIKSGESTVWPMSASVVKENPIRYRDVFTLSGSRNNPLGSKNDFEERYADSKRPIQIPTKWGSRVTVGIDYTWNTERLQEIRHRVACRTQSARKTDPGVRENFKGLQTIPVTIELSGPDRQLYRAIEEGARQARGRNEGLEPYYRLLRYCCNTPEALLRSESGLAARYVKEHRRLVNSANCTKLETLCDQVEAIRDAGDKVVVFTAWTNLSLFLLAGALGKRGIRLVQHFGTGMSANQQQDAVQRFKSDAGITCFLSSDAGAYGLNFQEARYVVNYEVPFSYDLLMQRSNRIDRADSWLDGLTSYVYITADSVEERIWDINNQRRLLAANTLGTQEVLSYSNETDPETLGHLIFGSNV